MLRTSTLKSVFYAANISWLCVILTSHTYLKQLRVGDDLSIQALYGTITHNVFCNCCIED